MLYELKLYAVTAGLVLLQAIPRVLGNTVAIPDWAGLSQVGATTVLAGLLVFLVTKRMPEQEKAYRDDIKLLMADIKTMMDSKEEQHRTERSELVKDFKSMLRESRNAAYEESRRGNPLHNELRHPDLYPSDIGHPGAGGETGHQET